MSSNEDPIGKYLLDCPMHNGKKLRHCPPELIESVGFFLVEVAWERREATRDSTPDDATESLPLRH